MESKLLKVKLKPGSKTKFFELLEYMKAQPSEPYSEMAQKGYFWDSFLLDEEDNLFMVLKSADFSSIMTDESRLIETGFRTVYEEFRKLCWIEGTYQDIEELYCFNKALSFLGKTNDA
jgi:hypothetical protein